LLADEWINTETFPDRVQADARQPDPASATWTTVFRNVARAHLSTLRAAQKFQDLADSTTNAGRTELLSLAGYTTLFFGENYCSGVPLSYPNPDGTINFGVPLTTAQILDTALDLFNKSIAAAALLTSATPRTTFTALAKVGKARVLLDLGQLADADTVV